MLNFFFCSNYKVWCYNGFLLLIPTILIICQENVNFGKPTKLHNLNVKQSNIFLQAGSIHN